MESTEDARRQLADLRRAEVLTHTRYPPTGRWAPAVAGTLGGLYTATFAMAGWPRSVCQLALVATVLLGTHSYQRKRGTWPRMWTAPAPLRSAYLRYGVGYLLLLAAIAGLWQVTSWWVTAGAAAIAATAGWALYERRFAKAAADAERGLADAERGLVGADADATDER